MLFEEKTEKQEESKMVKLSVLKQDVTDKEVAARTPTITFHTPREAVHQGKGTCSSFSFPPDTLAQKNRARTPSHTLSLNLGGAACVLYIYYREGALLIDEIPTQLQGHNIAFPKLIG